MPESKNLQRLTKPENQEKLRNARLYNNDKNTIYMPRQYTGNSLKSLDLSGKGKLHSSVLDQV